MNEHVALSVPVSDYDTDFFAWTQDQAALLLAGRNDLIDMENLAEEIRSLGASDKREVVRRFARIIEHLIKLELSRARYPRQKWRDSVNTQRFDLAMVFDDSPSLWARREELYVNAWRLAVALARKGLRREPLALAALATFGEQNIFTLEQVMNEEFYPGD